jgi:hydrogenase/urease accessory protein HupE
MKFFFSRKLICWLGLTLAALMLPLATWAHLVESGQGTVSLSGGKAYIVMSLPMDAFLNRDDGRISIDALRAHQSAFAKQAMQGIRLSVKGQTAVWTGMVLTLAEPKQGQSEPSDQLIAVGVADLNREQGEVTLALDLWRRPKTHSVANAITEVTRPAKEMLKVNISIIENEKKVAEEIGFLSPEQATIVFFAPASRHIANFFHHGFDHIMGGADHIVFLVALLASGISVRRWAALLTAFTLAHGLTFGLASMAWVSVSANLVEPAIAASIVLVAALHLLKLRIHLRWELALVFCLGLVHGLGFASAMQEDSAGQSLLLSPYPVWSILGFNLGIEAGQCVVAALLYLAFSLSRLVPIRNNDVLLQKCSGVFAILIGTFWLVERMM